jgi:hypothetical protein
MLIANLDMRIDSAVSRHLLPEPKRRAAVRTLLLAFGALFALVALCRPGSGFRWARRKIATPDAGAHVFIARA